jgi:hypothetical protein
MSQALYVCDCAIPNTYHAREQRGEVVISALLALVPGQNLPALAYRNNRVSFRFWRYSRHHRNETPTVRADSELLAGRAEETEAAKHNYHLACIRPSKYATSTIAAIKTNTNHIYHILSELRMKPPRAVVIMPTL